MKLNKQDAFRFLRSLHCVTFAVVTLLSSCVHEIYAPSFKVVPTYPETTIRLGHGLVLKHKTAKFGDEDDLPKHVPISEVARYELFNQHGRKLGESTSSLSDPKFAGVDFESSFRNDDKIEVFVSASGLTILVVEDRPHAVPVTELRLIELAQDKAWRASKLLAPHFNTDSNMKPLVYGSYATVRGITDSTVLFSHGKRNWSEKFANLQKPAGHPRF